MIEEADVTREKAWYHEDLAKIVIKHLEKGHIDGRYAKTRKEALAIVLDLIPEGAVVGRGDSVTLEQIGVFQALIERNKNTIINPYVKDENGHFPVVEERRKLQREALLSDVFLTGTNAITMDGKIVSIDGAGNRVAAMIFGPKKVIVITGVNKIVKDVDDAINRIHRISAPLNGKRHMLKHGLDEGHGTLPCIKTGTCTDCKKHKYRMCRYTVIIEGTARFDKGRMHVVLVGEELGY
ncbi:lactate utilization protein [Thermodesulfobacteriota bacterium]